MKDQQWRLWQDVPLIGVSLKEASAFSDFTQLSEPIYVQEVYVMDGFLRALAEFRSPQGVEEKAIPIPACAHEPLKCVKRRFFEQVQRNFAAIQDEPQLIEKYGEECSVRPYNWVGTYFADGWDETDLKWLTYQSYDLFLDSTMWCFYGPDMKTELFEETTVEHVKGLIDAHKVKMGMTTTGANLAKATSIDAVYLLPTHIRVMLFNEQYERLMYTLPRDTTFEALKTIVEEDLKAPGVFKKFDCGPPDNKFGPGKSFGDVFTPTTMGVSHAWT